MTAGDGPVSGLVSVIIPFLNAARFLAEAIDSVIGQTYSEWELLLIDDGSADASSGIAQEYAAKHPGRIRYYTHPGGINRGMCTSRNRACATVKVSSWPSWMRTTSGSRENWKNKSR